VPSPLPGGQRRRLDRACVQSGEDPIPFKKQVDALLSSRKFKETKKYNEAAVQQASAEVAAATGLVHRVDSLATDDSFILRIYT
jgi:hypothetical protein